MFDISNYDFTYITDKTVKLEEYFINSYVDECLKSESGIISTSRIHIVLDAKYEKANLKTAMDEKCQHISSKERYTSNPVKKV